jgi:hypothetical protein
MLVQYLRYIFFGTAIIAMTPVGSQAQTCPWMTPGSAAKLLGGEATATIQIVDDKQGSCSFVRSDGKAGYSLAIVVSHKAVEACPEGSMAVKGIGNDAQWCSVRQSSTETFDRISSRVRDAFFTVALRVAGLKNGGMTEEMRHDILDQAAELVAGNLF